MCPSCNHYANSSETLLGLNGHIFSLRESRTAMKSDYLLRAEMTSSNVFLQVNNVLKTILNKAALLSVHSTRNVQFKKIIKYIREHDFLWSRSFRWLVIIDWQWFWCSRPPREKSQIVDSIGLTAQRVNKYPINANDERTRPCNLVLILESTRMFPRKGVTAFH